jgi:2-hydroxychromene-2-carboxylate isomerase
MSVVTYVDLYFDPACPFAWITSRWLREVQRYRAVDVRLRPMSLYLLNAGREVAPGYRTLLDRSPTAARVFAAAVRRHGDGALPELYTALGNTMFTAHNHEVVHSPRERSEEWAAVMREAIGKALAQVGLGQDLAAAADSPEHDDILRSNQDEMIGAVGPDVGTPVVHIGNTAVFGPVLTSIPRGLYAALMFDAVRLLTGNPNFFELKRSLTGELSFA